MDNDTQLYLEKIKQYEREGKFDKDIFDDPPTKTLNPQDIDYLHTKLKTKILSKFALFCGKIFFEKQIKNKQLIIKEIIGKENLDKVSGGAIITCNHFNLYDNYIVYKTIKSNVKKGRFYKVIREGNYTNPPKGFKLILKYGDTLPLSSNLETMKKFMKSVSTLLKNGQKILIYPEQSLWPNYKKPKPLKPGAFNLSVINNVPIIPIFITMQDSEIKNKDGTFVQSNTVHILPPIYPNPALSKKDNMEYLKEQNYNCWKETYEKFYQTKLVYEK